MPVGPLRFLGSIVVAISTAWSESNLTRETLLMTRCAYSPILLSFTLALAATCAVAQSQETPAVNAPTIYKTIVPHRNSVTHPLQSPSLPAEAGEIAPPGFTQPPYIVGPVVSPTSTVPEAEEHGVADPNNNKNLFRAIAVGTSITGRHRVAGGGRLPPAPTERSVRFSRTTLVRS